MSNEGLARQIEKKAFKGKRNKIVDAFIEVLKEDPDIEIMGMGDSRVCWRFKVDSEPVRVIAGHISDYTDMTKDERRAYDKMEKKYEKEAMSKAYKKLGTLGVIKAVKESL